MVRLAKIFILIERRDQQKNFLWVSRLWVGRRKEPILGYDPKNDEKKTYETIWRVNNAKFLFALFYKSII